MNNNKPKLTHPQQQNLKKLPQLQLLNLAQLEGVAGGPLVRTDHNDPN